MNWKPALLLAVPLAACSAGADVPKATEAVADFRKHMAEGKCDAIYGTAAAEFRGATSKERWHQLCEVFRTKLGAFNSGNQTGWNDQYVNGLHLITLTYETSFVRGEGIEQFTYRIDNGKAKLAGYHVNSDALIIN